MASDYGNLGNVYRTRGDLDRAEEMYKKSLEISEPGGLLELSANQYANLGSVYEQRGDVARAREYWARAVGLYERIGMPHMVAKVRRLIDGLPQDRQ
jgi:tetratricopeptide (TPR) repeat protein